MRTYAQKRGICQAEHGQRARYVQGCRCGQCRAANAAHARKRYLARLRGGADPLVGSTVTRNYLKRLQAAGIGSRVIADLTGVGRSIVCGLAVGRRRKCRRSTQDRILAVTLDAWAGRHLVDAGPTWDHIQYLIDLGWTRRELARKLGSTAANPRIQIGRKTVRADTAARVKRMFQTTQNERPRLRRLPG